MGFFKAFSQLFIAPFGGVQFKVYLLGEILTDCYIQLEDIGRIFYMLALRDWTPYLDKKKADTLGYGTPPNGLKYWFFFVSFMPFWFRMCQNLKKWLWKGHGVQKWNVLKYFILICAQVSIIIYMQTHIKAFKYLYFVLKTAGTFFKIYWDFIIDWGLFSGTKEGNKWLRDETKFSPRFYYTCMAFDIFGLFFWVISYKWVAGLIDPPSAHSGHEAHVPEDTRLYFFNSVNEIAWLEMAVLAIRRTVWVLIRVENEFFNNVEQYRDITVIPPLGKK